MSTVINIENLHVNTLLLGEVARGVAPDFLNDTGDQVYEDSQVDEIQDPNEAAKLQRRQAWAEVLDPIPDHVKPGVRKAHILKAMKTAAKLRMYRGGVTTTQQTGITDMEAVEDCLDRADVSFAASLAKACGKCAFRDNCSLQGRPEAWLNAHPTDDRTRTNKKQQTFPEFKDSLDINAMAHCVPTKNHQHRKALKEKTIIIKR